MDLNFDDLKKIEILVLATYICISPCKVIFYLNELNALMYRINQIERARTSAFKKYKYLNFTYIF